MVDWTIGIGEIVTVLGLVFGAGLLAQRFDRRLEKVEEAMTQVIQENKEAHSLVAQAMRDSREQMLIEHREFLKMSQETLGILVEINTKLDTHLQDERVNRTVRQ